MVYDSLTFDLLKEVKLSLNEWADEYSDVENLKDMSLLR